MTLHIMTEKTSPKCIQWKKAKCTTVYAVCYAIFWDKEGWNNKAVFPICLYMHTMNLEGWDKTPKEVTNSGYKGRRKGDFIVHLVIFCEFWTIYYPWKMLKNKRLTNQPKFTELEWQAKLAFQSWFSKSVLSNIPPLGLIWSLLLSKCWTPGGLMARECSVPQISFLWASWSSAESTGVGFLVFSFGFHCKRHQKEKDTLRIHW